MVGPLGHILAGNASCSIRFDHAGQQARAMPGSCLLQGVPVSASFTLSVIGVFTYHLQLCNVRLAQNDRIKREICLHEETKCSAQGDPSCLRPKRCCRFVALIDTEDGGTVGLSSS